MKRAVIVHCWGGNPRYCWYPETKRELQRAGFKVSVPAMPETESPKLKLWLPKLKEAASRPDENLHLIGHSIGCAAILRYLESLKEGESVGGVVLVAGFTDNLGFKELKNFFSKPLDFKKIKSSARAFTAIHSDNDPYVNLKYGRIFKRKLGAGLIIKHAMKHFSGAADSEKSCASLPDVSAAILKMAKNHPQ